jgi:hypothetical protein
VRVANFWLARIAMRLTIQPLPPFAHGVLQSTTALQVGRTVALRTSREETPMLDALEPWMIRSAVLISALFLLDAALYLICARLERRQWLRAHSPTVRRPVAHVQRPTEASPQTGKVGRSVAA